MMGFSQYYSLEEVIKKLNRSRSTVLREAKAGLIPSEIEEGKKKGRLYPKQAIDALLELEHEKNQHTKMPRLIFSPSTPSDLWAEVTIGTGLYGEEDIVPYKTLLQWRDRNASMFMSVKEEGKVIAYSSLMPIDEQVLQDLIQDKVREKDIPLSAIKQWQDTRLSVYVASVTVKPIDNEERAAARGFEILRHTISWAVTQHRQYDIKNWYGIGATKEGQHLFERLGFTQIVSLHNGERKGYYLESSTAVSTAVSNFFASASSKIDEETGR